MKTLTRSFPRLLPSVLFLSVACCAPLVVAARLEPAPASAAPPVPNLPPVLIHEARFDGALSDQEARFKLVVHAESNARRDVAVTLLEGDVALLPARLPAGVRLERAPNGYRLVFSRPGAHTLEFELVAKVHRAEPWNQVAFKGPAAAVAPVTARAAGADVDLELLSGTPLETARNREGATVRGFLGPDATLTLRWQSRAAEGARKPLLAADTVTSAHLTPTVIKYETRLRFEVAQGRPAKLAVALPAAQTLTRLTGEHIRDWSVAAEADRQVITIEFLKPLERETALTLLSEQSLETLPAAVGLAAPQPLDVERESGSLVVTAEDVQAEVESASGLRQVNAPSGAVAAWRFNARPASLTLWLRRIEPLVTLHDRVRARLEETRLLVSHALTLTVEKAGIYAAEFALPAGAVVADVQGEGIEDWKVSDRRLRVSFPSRVLGVRRLDVHLEQPLKSMPERIVLEPLRMPDAARVTAQIAAGAAPGFRLKTAELLGAREIPVQQLERELSSQPSETADEWLAFAADAPDWKLTLAVERLPGRVVAEIFNLVTVGDGLVGGSATIRYAFLHQGVQELHVALPAHWKNVEFIGPAIRRKELVTAPASAGSNTVVWLIGLQEKARGGYTLVVSYDFAFEPGGARLALGGAHALDAERESGWIAVTTAANLKIEPVALPLPLRRVDEAELSPADRALITRSVLLACHYEGPHYDLSVDVKRFEEAPVLSAVADRTQLTTVLTEAGELLTQASFMVKNNDKQFQRFRLPNGAEFWSCTVNGQPAKPERDGDWLLVPLPRALNRNEPFAVELVYAEKTAPLKSGGARTLALRAPQTDVPNTYAEWELYAPAALRLSAFGGTMRVAEGTVYGALDAWWKFLAFYRDVLRELGARLVLVVVLGVVILGLVIVAVRWGWNGVLTALGVLVLIAVLAVTILPALASAKTKAQRVSSLNNLKMIGLELNLFAGDHAGRLPNSFEEMADYLPSRQALVDPETGQPYVYVGGGWNKDDIAPDSIIAFAPVTQRRCHVLFADGSVQTLSAEAFAERARQGLIRRRTPEYLARGPTTNAPAGEPPASRAPAPSAEARAAGLTPAIAGAPAETPSPRPVVTGVRSLRIGIPRAGNLFTFTKVLNVRDEPLAISFQLMPMDSYLRRQMALQAAAFLVGLLVWLWQWRGRRNTFVLTVALALMLGALSSLLVQWRALHDALIVGFPVVGLAVLSWLVWRFWPRPSPTASAPKPGGDAGAATAPATAAMVLVGLLLWGDAALGATDASKESGGSDAGISIGWAEYTGTANDRLAQLDATLQLDAVVAGRTLPLFGEEVVVQAMTSKPAGAKLLRQDRQLLLWLPRKGETTVQLKLLVRVSGDAARRQVAFRVPPALNSRLSLAVEQPDAVIEFPGAVSSRVVAEGSRTRLEALLGAGERVDVAWTPRVKRAAEVAATVVCENTALVSFGPGAVSVRATLDYQVTQGELRQARVQLPGGHRLFRVEGEDIRTWSVREEGNAPVLVVEWLRGASPSRRLTLATEKPLESLPVNVRVEIPHALDVKREAGLIGLRAEEDLELTVARADELQRVDAAAFAALAERLATNDVASGAPGAGSWVSAFRFLKPDFALETRLAALQPQIEAVVYNALRVSDEQLSLTALVDYAIKRAGIFDVKLRLPEGFRVDAVSGGSNLLHWSERTNEGGRVLEVALKQRLSGEWTLRIELSRRLAGWPGTLDVPAVHPLRTAKLTTYVAVLGESGVALKTAGYEGLTEIPPASVPQSRSGETVWARAGWLTFKHIATEPGTAPGWRLTMAAEPVEPWVRAETAATITITDSRLTGRARVRYEIQNAPVQEFRLHIPASFRNVEISGLNIRRRDRDGEQWRVELQGRVRGHYELVVTWEQARDAADAPWELAAPTPEGVERSIGILAVVARPPLSVSETRAADLLNADASEWPDWAGAPDAHAVMFRRYLRPGWQLAVQAKRFEEAEVLQTLAEDVRLSTVVAEDGQMITELRVALRNHGRQYLEVALPPGATVWSAFVGGRAVRPSVREGRLLLPLDNTGPDDPPLSLEVTYVSAATFPARRGAVALTSPAFDVPLQNARWELYLPSDYRYDDFAGTMSHEQGKAEPVAALFSRVDYSQKESEVRARWAKGLETELGSARRKLAEGKVREAAESLSRVRQQALGFERSGVKDEQALEREVNQALASNLLQAQGRFWAENVGPLGGRAPAQASGGGALDDAGTHLKQSMVVQRAQEIAAPRLLPLRVNLPVRGLRLSFTQALQTEANKPMTIQFTATNLRAPNWWKRLGGGVAAFVVLWAIVAMATAGRKPARG